MAILDVNTLGALTRTTLAGCLSNLVQRESLRGPTCMPMYFLFDFKSGRNLETLADTAKYIIND